MSEHPSEYALDRAALGAEVPPEVAAHLARCATCAARVAERGAPGAPPPWLDAVKIAPPPRRRRPWPLWLVPIPALAAAMGLLLAVRLPPAGGVRAKGAPHVTVFVKRGDRVTQWDGRSAVRPGDRLGLSVRGAGYAQVSIASLSAGAGAPSVLWSGPLERAGETVPPVSFRVDADGAAEDLSVVLSMRAVAPWQHGTAPPRGNGTWSTRLHLPKEPAR